MGDDMGNFLNGLQKLWQNKMMRIFIISIVGIIILIIILSLAFSNTSSSVTTDTALINAAKRYMENDKNKLPTNDYDMRTVSLVSLVSAGYIKSDDSSSCSSYVTVVKMGNDYIYTPYIKCNKNNDSVLLSNKLLSNIVDTGAGLYKYNDKYIYRGEIPNNYVLLGGVKWRIVGLDSMNNIKLIFDDIVLDYESWDDRYNNEVDTQDGINDYNLSRIKDYLDSYFDKYGEIFTNNVKARLTKYSVCTGKVDLASSLYDSCSTTLDNQLASVITVNDYMNASLDTLCSKDNVKNCQNYNYLNKNSWTITAYKNDTVKVYYVDQDEGIKLASAYIAKGIRPVIALRNDIIYVSGTGTEVDPYIIK